jgi:RNA polymerase sigma-70 factor (ECF subfamily)
LVKAWRQFSAELVPSPVIALNRAVAVAMADGPAAGLALVNELADTLAGYPRLPAVRADLLRRLGRRDEAAAAYRAAIAVAPTGAERDHLTRMLAEATG